MLNLEWTHKKYMKLVSEKKETSMKVCIKKDDFLVNGKLQSPKIELYKTYNITSCDEVDICYVKEIYDDIGLLPLEYFKDIEKWRDDRISSII